MRAADLIEELCVPMGQRASAWTSHRDDEHRVTVHAGFVASPWAEDGHEFMARATAQADAVLGESITGHPAEGPLQVRHEVGNWPYEVVMTSEPENAIVRYVEGDLAVEVYDDHKAMQAAWEREQEKNAAQ